MTDKQFLHWIADRLVYVHGDQESGEFVQNLRKIADESGPGPEEISRMKDRGNEDALGMSVFIGATSVAIVLLLIWGAFSV